MIKTIKSILKGYIGEQKMRLINSIMLGDDNYLSISNLTLPNEYSSNLKTTQIDGLILDKRNNLIFVIEAKNYNHCDIAGDISEKTWKVSYNGSAKDFTMYNPLFQNYGHIKNIQNILNKHNINIPLNQFHSIIYFLGKEKLYLHNRQNNNSHLFSINNIVSNHKEYLSCIKRKRISFPSNYDADKVFNILNDANLTKKIGLTSLYHSYKHKKEVKKYTR